MLFVINNVDINMREKVQEAIKDGKVHHNQKIYPLKWDKRQNQNPKQKFTLKKGAYKKNKIVVTAQKENSIDVDMHKDIDTIETDMGKYLDVRK